MSPENKFSPELASFESRLRAEPLADSTVDRDGLMYQAGWAAAEASRKTGWMWPTTSGVLAASVLVLAGLLVGGEVETGPVAGVPVLKHQAAKPQAKGPRVLPRIEVVEVRQRRWRSPMQAMRRWELDQEYQQPFSFDSSEVDDQKSEVLTARQLLQEMLGETS